MPMLERLASLLRNLLHKREVEKDLDDEMDSFLDLLTEEKVRGGMSPKIARRAARIEVGGLEQTKEQSGMCEAGPCSKRYGVTFGIARPFSSGTGLFDRSHRHNFTWHRSKHGNL